MLCSSHVLEEVEQVADRVTMIHQGTIALSAPLDEIRESHRAHVGTAAPAAPGAAQVTWRPEG